MSAAVAPLPIDVGVALHPLLVAHSVSKEPKSSSSSSFGSLDAERVSDPSESWSDDAGGDEPSGGGGRTEEEDNLQQQEQEEQEEQATEQEEEEVTEEEASAPLQHVVDLDAADQRAFLADNRRSPLPCPSKTNLAPTADWVSALSNHASGIPRDAADLSSSESDLLDSSLASSHDEDFDQYNDGNDPSQTIEDDDRQRDLFCRQMERMTPPSDSIGFLALLIPICGVATMVTTTTVTCLNHFDCTHKYPTISWAACFFPERYIFMFGMCTTALCIFCTILLFYWFLRLTFRTTPPPSSTSWPTARSTPSAQWNQQIYHLAHSSLFCGFGASTSLFGLAVFDLENYNEIHMTLSITFFAFAWMTMVSIHLVRCRVFASAAQTSFVQVLQRIRQGTCPRQLAAFTLGRGCLYTGIGATAVFLVFFLCVNGIWPNPYEFTESQEGLFESLAIVCQLFFMGSCSMELSLLNKVVEDKEYLQLHRHE